MVYKETLIFFLNVAMNKPELVPLHQAEIQSGKPLEFPILNANHTLLFSEGQIIPEESRLEELLVVGIYRPAAWRIAHREPSATENRSAQIVPTRDFAQLQLFPGTTAHIRIEEKGSHFASCKLLGWITGEDIIVSTPESLSPAAGTQMEVKLLAGKGVVSFQAAIRANSRTPYNHLHLTYPETISIRKLRKNLRVSVTLTAMASSNHDSISHDASLANLSICGGMLEFPQYFAQTGDELLLMFSLPAGEQDNTLVMRAHVRNVHSRAGETPLMQYGLEFIDPNPAERALIEHYIFQAMLEN